MTTLTVTISVLIFRMAARVSSEADVVLVFDEARKQELTNVVNIIIYTYRKISQKHFKINFFNYNILIEAAKKLGEKRSRILHCKIIN